VDAVLLGPGCADPLYRRSVRVSMGHVLRVPFAPLQRWPEDLDTLQAAGFRVVALTPASGAVPLMQAGVVTGRVAWLLGAEGAGLSGAALSAADLAVRIPMAPGVDSLNVATAAAIAFAGARRV
jgi:tRNA G18 (ribose-2'-O)-methylase SpoU